MKVVVANPPWPGKGYGARTNVRWPHRRGDKALAFPIYLAYAVSVLKKDGFEVKGYDAVEREWNISKFMQEMKRIDPKLILLEISAPSIMYDLETLAILRKELPNTMLAVCGPYATYAHKELIDNYRFIDVAIKGEFEYTLRDLCYAVRENKPLNKILGITFRKDDITITTSLRPPIDNLDEMPMPDREDFKIENYQQAFYCGKKTALMISARGCPFECTYCVWPQTISYRRYRVRSAKNFVDEIDYLIRKEGIDEIFIDDDEFILHKKKVFDICNEIKSRNIKIRWQCMGRVDMVDEKLLKAMKDAGCYQIFFGFESGSDKILKSIKKKITTEQIKNAVKLTKKSGIIASGSFVLGMPEEDLKSANETINFAKNLGADWVQFTIAAPYPGTEFYEEAKKNNLLEIDSLADLDGSKGVIIRTKYLTKDQLKGLQRMAYVKYYTHPKIILQNLRKIGNIKDARRIIRGARSVLSRVMFYKA